MISKEKLKSLTKYLADLNSKLASGVPAKHVGHPETYKQFLKNEIDTVSKQLEAAKLTGVK